MSTASPVDSRKNLRLVIERIFPAGREQIFQAWTDPSVMEKWFAPPGMQPVGITTELAVGGKYQIGMRHADGTVHVASGQYREIRPPEKLVFTWSWQTDPPGTETLVTLELFEHGTGTRLVLTHERFPTLESQEDHKRGWEGCLEQLQQAIIRRSI